MEQIPPIKCKNIVQHALDFVHLSRICASHLFGNPSSIARRKNALHFANQIIPLITIEYNRLIKFAEGIAG
ncbi:MAG: hypothetical protein CVU64_04070 [Deltaproteobacteria bacterium HGW-Deltaproteobacteria-21]|jgi:hypothetical protein|nr:MAG: hypothetical protein CVU64_04070 [Deltaproteobacteria bacterium HGW-Deltaproteobacteria-21]